MTQEHYMGWLAFRIEEIKGNIARFEKGLERPDTEDLQKHRTWNLASEKGALGLAESALKKLQEK